MAPRDGGPAYPVESIGFAVGISVRDWFAGHALASLLTNEHVRNEIYAYAGAAGIQSSTALAKQAYLLADAMLAARKAK